MRALCECVRSGYRRRLAPHRAGGVAVAQATAPTGSLTLLAALPKTACASRQGNARRRPRWGRPLTGYAPRFLQVSFGFRFLMLTAGLGEVRRPRQEINGMPGLDDSGERRTSRRSTGSAFRPGAAVLDEASNSPTRGSRPLRACGMSRRDANGAPAGTMRCRTGSVQASGTGAPSARMRGARCASWRWRTSV